MALQFELTTGEEVDHGAMNALDDIATVTYMIWFKPTNISAANRLLINKGVNNFFLYSGASGTGGAGTMRIRITHASTHLDYQSNSGTVTDDVWQFLVAVVDTGAANDERVQFYRGTLTTLAVEVGYQLTTEPSGARTSDASSNIRVMRLDSPELLAEGDIAWAGIWNKVLTLAECQAQQFHPHVTSGCQLFTHYGYNGTGTQPDWSGQGNNGTITGAGVTVADHVPLGPPFGFDVGLPFPAAAAAGFVPYPNPRYALTGGMQDVGGGISQ